jgi:hypothetical protein
MKFCTRLHYPKEIVVAVPKLHFIHEPHANRSLPIRMPQYLRPRFSPLYFQTGTRIQIYSKTGSGGAVYARIFPAGCSRGGRLRMPSRSPNSIGSSGCQMITDARLLYWRGRAGSLGAGSKGGPREGTPWSRQKEGDRPTARERSRKDAWKAAGTRLMARPAHDSG